MKLLKANRTFDDIDGIDESMKWAILVVIVVVVVGNINLGIHFNGINIIIQWTIHSIHLIKLNKQIDFSQYLEHEHWNISSYIQYHIYYY